MAATGRIGPDVRVVDTTMTRLRELRERGVERPATETWHGRAFFKVGTTS
jgi:hypothetical protein